MSYAQVTIPTQLRDRILAARERLLAAEVIPTGDELTQILSGFRERFGPATLDRLEGEELLETVHNHSNRDSLVYWLEFKNDDEFPAVFGSIAGGSALKFGLYRRKETGAWMTGRSVDQREVTTAEAIKIAAKHRDQLVRGTKLLDEMPGEASQQDYLKLQTAMDREATDVSRAAWGHKYFHLMHPERLDDFHVTHFQQYFLVKLLLRPPDGDKNRYAAGAFFAALREELGIPMNHLTRAMGECFGSPQTTWRLFCRYQKPDRDGWPMMRDGGYVAVGWKQLPDMTTTLQASDPREALKKSLLENLGERGENTRDASQLYAFAAKMEEGDTVLASYGPRVFGMGEVTGAYEYVADGTDWPHRRAVRWIDDGEWTHPALDTPSTRVFQAVRNLDVLVDSERHKLGGTIVVPPPTVEALRGVPLRIQEILKRKGQVVLYGPPGTGKTYWAKKASIELAARENLGIGSDSLTETQRERLLGPEGYIRSCTFHPAYGYEDFLEGYRPHTVDGQLSFQMRAGVFKQLCQTAAANPVSSYYLIIDEINRGDIPRIFGELLTLLEMDKRTDEVVLPVSGDTFSVPPNVFVIGTMNTADRSIALLDAALRRRFGFVELMPDSSLLDRVVIEGMDLKAWFQALNGRIIEELGSDARNLQIGHAYFLTDGKPVSALSQLACILRDDVVPLIQEYCYEDTEALERILGSGMYDRKRQRVRDELFTSGREEALVEALAAPAPDVRATADATTAEVEEDDEDLEQEEAAESEQASAP